MDDIVRDVNDGWNEKDPSRPLTMQFKGSDDYLRAKVDGFVGATLGIALLTDHTPKSLKITSVQRCRPSSTRTT